MADPNSMGTTSGNGHMPGNGALPHAMEVLRESVNQPRKNGDASGDKSFKVGDANGKSAPPESQVGVAAMHKTVEAMTTNAEQAGNLGRHGFAAIAKSSQIWTSGLQDMSRLMADAAQAYVDSAMSTWGAMSNVKTVKELMELQTNLIRTSLERAMADTSKLTSFSMKLAEESMEPVTARMRVTAETLTHPTV